MSDQLGKDFHSLPIEIQEHIIAEGENYSSDIDKRIFIHGAVFMYRHQQQRISELEVEIDLLEREIY